MAETKEKDYQISSLIIDACDELDDYIKENKEDDTDIKDYLYGHEVDDFIHEIADSAIPIYYWDIGQYAAHTSWLMTEIPEINPNGNAHDQIQSNIYEAVCEGLYEHIAEKETEDE